MRRGMGLGLGGWIRGSCKGALGDGLSWVLAM